MQRIENHDFLRIYQKLNHKSARVEINRTEKNIWYLARVYVPPDYRNQKIATGFLEDILTWADEKHVTLVTEINSHDGLAKEKLIEILKQYGFKQLNDFQFIRQPVSGRKVIIC